LPGAVAGAKINSLMADVYSENRVKGIVREETADMRHDIAELKLEVRRIGLIQEDMQDDLKTVLEMLSDALGIRPVVRAHGIRLAALEQEQLLARRTLSSHSRELKNRRSG
jgi:hypothetical protein